MLADNEAKERYLLLGKFKNVEHEMDGAQEVLDEEIVARDNCLRQVAKSEGEAAMWHSKYEKEAVAKAEELEMAKMKLQARLTERESTIENLNGKLCQLEKAKQRVQMELDELNIKLDQAQVMHSAMERKVKQFDKVISEWKAKVDSLSHDLDISQKETRNASADLFRVKAAYDESVLQLDEVRRENKVLSNEIKDIMDQISEGGRSIHEIDKIRKRLEAEKLELQSALEEAEATLEQEENKVLRAELELNQVRLEIDRRISLKEEEFMSIKKTQTKAIESMQSALEAESKAKAEALRMKKKLETDVGDLDMALDHANASVMETQAACKKYQLQIRDAAMKVEEESHLKSIVIDQKVQADRKATAMQNALEEARTMLEQADKQRRTFEMDLSDTNETLAELSNQNQAICASKKKLEANLNSLNVDLDETASEVSLSEGKAVKAMVDAARLADELRMEQDTVIIMEKERKLLEAQCKDSQNRVDEAEVNALKGGKKAMMKMETRIHELESELEAETRRFGDSQRNLRKSERRIKELTYSSDEDRKNHERMQALIDQLQSKIKTYKKQIEEAEEIAALNLAKFRQTQNYFEEASAAADVNEQALARCKARGRSCSVGPM